MCATVDCSQYYKLLRYQDTKLRSTNDADRAEKFQEVLQDDYKRQLERERKHRMKEDAK